MTAKWRFEPKRRSQKSRDPMQASFFTNASIDDDTHALVREAIQNSLDAKADTDSLDPVHVRFSIGSHAAGDGVMEHYISDVAWLHFNAEDNGLKTPPNMTHDCRYLVYEDFNTDGLVGDERAFEAEPDNSFYYFMRAEGQSGKQQGERGRHGIGKYVFPYTSGIRMFIVATVRSSDNRCLIAGQSVLKSHHIGDDRFTPDGWWGDFEKDGEDDYFQLPVEDHDLFSQLVSDFGLARTIEQAGLSIVMPYIQSEVTANRLSEHVVREYFWPILGGQLVVDVAEDGELRQISSATVHDNLDDLLLPEQIEKITPYIALAHAAQTKDDYPIVELQLPSAPSLPKWDKDYLSKEAATLIQKQLAKRGEFVCIRCPLHVQENETGEVKASHFEIFLSKDGADTKRKPQFVREGIIIPEDRVSKTQGYTSVVVIERGPLATLLGDSENPAHTEWEKNATKFKGKYRWGPTTIDFVRLCVSKLLNLLSQGDEEEDLAILSDIFYLDLPENDNEVPDSRKQRKKPVTGGTEDEPSPEPPPPRPRTYRLSKSNEGFIVRGPTVPLDKKRRYLVKVAYDFAGASKARAMKQWDQNDFHLSKATNVNAPEVDNVKIVSVGGNTLEFEAESSVFKVSVQGFDSRRDLIVDIASEAVRDEAI